eukprot:scaffold71510_cov29-Phaeocystis_antarctica.AAC.1
MWRPHWSWRPQRPAAPMVGTGCAQPPRARRLRPACARRGRSPCVAQRSRGQGVKGLRGCGSGPLWAEEVGGVSIGGRVVWKRARSGLGAS